MNLLLILFLALIFTEVTVTAVLHGEWAGAFATGLMAATLVVWGLWVEGKV